MTETYKEQIKRIALDEEKFVRLTVKGKAMPWRQAEGEVGGRPQESPLSLRQVIVRPVMIKRQRHLQFSYFTEKQDITKNYSGAQAGEKLDEVLALPFSSITAQAIDQILRVRSEEHTSELQSRFDL